jgi:uridylate kinase
MDRANADYMGMMASVINALALQDAMEKQGLSTRVLSALEIRDVAEPYIRRRAERHLEKGPRGRVRGRHRQPVLLHRHRGRAACREIHADVILMGKNGVDGVYSADPKLDPKAVRYERVRFDEALQKNLRVMDQTALALCRENKTPIIVFDISRPGNLRRVASGEEVGTRVEE